MHRSAFVLFWVVSLPGFATPEIAFFERHIRPILVERCYECHSADAKIKGGLSLDTRLGWEVGGDSGPAIVPGDPEKSPLIQAVRYDDPDLEMPPKGSLPNAEIERLIEWVEMGAPDPRDGGTVVERPGIDFEAARQEWLYQTPREHPLPAVKDADWPRTVSDTWLLAGLEAEGLAPNGPATPGQRLRRASLVLTGLPPSLDHLSRFEAQPDEATFAALVDEMLGMPQFGERWGRHWLDVARFADSSGGGRSKVWIDAWRYRDYVISSFNQDKPYDAFVREQLAGDLLSATDPVKRAEQLTATGYLLLAPTNFENQDKQALDLDVADEQVDTLGRTFMGLTIGCARCHDHKFDPISHDDYHAIAGIFMNTKSLNHQNVSVVNKQLLPVAAAQQAANDAHERAMKQIDTRIGALRKEVAQAKRAEPAPVLQRRDGIVIDDEAASLDGDWRPSTVVAGYIGPHYLHDSGAAKGSLKVVWATQLATTNEQEVLLSYSPSGNRASQVPVRVVHRDGTHTVSVNQRVVPPIERSWISLGTYFFSSNMPARVEIINSDDSGVTIADAVWFRDRKAALTPELPLGVQSNRVSALEAELAEVDAEKKRLIASAPPPLPRTMAVSEVSAPGNMKTRLRGLPHKLGKPVPRGFLTVATSESSPIIRAGSGRLELAEWLTGPEHPLTARVMVNRIWQHVFGVGLIRSPDNVGKMGERPSHPELLDVLALRYQAGGWSTKSMIRELVLSRGFAMSSEVQPEAYRADPENRLYWRMDRRRIEVEALRDSMLSVAGELDERVGGPMFESKLSQVHDYRFTNVRRSVYQPVFRNNLHPMFAVFDGADPNLVMGRRSVSTLPTQALFVMNSPQIMDWAAKAATRLEAVPEGERLERLYRLAFSRAPRVREAELAQEYLGEAADRERWAGFVQTLFASYEFRTLY